MVLIATHLDRATYDLLRRHEAGYSTGIDNILRGSDVRSTIAASPRRLSATRLPGPMDDFNPADFSASQPHFDSMRVKRGVRKKVLDDASGLFPSALVLFKDNGNICSTRNVTSVPSIHEIYPFRRLAKNFIRAAFNNNPLMQGDACVCPYPPPIFSWRLPVERERRAG